MILILKHGAICQQRTVSDTENPTLRSEISHVNGAPQTPDPRGSLEVGGFSRPFFWLSPLPSFERSNEI